jgi:GMP synthase-like glutamine amidotransferase
MTQPAARRGPTADRTALFIQHSDRTPPALLDDWCATNGIALHIHRIWEHGPLPSLDGHAFLVTAGSAYSPNDVNVRDVRDELHLLDQALDRELPVLGLCFGAQMLAVVLGGSVHRLATPELGWYEVDSTDPGVPPGPWLQWHYSGFDQPPEVEQLASSPAGCQVFRRGSSLGVQFHPESTLTEVSGWARKDAERLQALGIDGLKRLSDGSDNADAARRAAFTLFHSFGRWSGVTHKSEAV